MTPDRILVALGTLCAAAACIAIIVTLVGYVYLKCFRPIKRLLETHTPFNDEVTDATAFGLVMLMWSAVFFALLYII